MWIKLLPSRPYYQIILLFNLKGFRSRAVIEFGDVIDISQELVELYKQGGQKKRDAISTLMCTTLEHLKAITICTPDYQTLMVPHRLNIIKTKVVQAARRLYKPENVKLALNDVLALTRNLAIGYEQFGQELKVKEFTKRVLNYNLLLKTYGIKDHQVKNVNIGGKRAVFLLIYRVVRIVLVGVLMIPGLIINLPVTFIARRISHNKMKGIFQFNL